MNYIKPAANHKSRNMHSARHLSYHTLAMVSVTAVTALTEAVYELSSFPVKILSVLDKLIRHLCAENRERESIDLLYIIHGMLGVEHAAAIRLLREDAEARGYFLYAFIADLGEVLEELSEGGADT
jgi:hypothetical protein